MAILDTPTPRPAAELPKTTRTDRLVRADDQLSLTLEFLNLDVGADGGTLVTVDPRQPFTGVRMIFGSQRTVEDTIGAGEPTSSAGVDNRTARESRLVVPLPPGTPYALSAILDRRQARSSWASSPREVILVLAKMLRRWKATVLGEIQH